MKGGITSGVVYPPAVYELSREFVFRGIGGTSAGAIAAAATAAAEYGRRNGLDSFAKIESLPQWLGERAEKGGETNLFSLFQPAAGTSRLFGLVKAALGEAGGRFWRVADAAVTSYRLPFFVGTVPGVLFALLALLPGHWLLRLAVVGGGVVAAFVGALLSIGWRVKADVLRRIPENGFGICPGHSEHTGSSYAAGPVPPLTDWLTAYLNDLAGKPLSSGPLTFGDLWGTRDPESERRVDLQMMTTNLTHGRPYRLPFRERIFFFHPEELRRLFPGEVVDWMVRHARKSADSDASAPLVPLPEAADLPVVFAARLSLSFPVLISAVPLYAIDFSRRRAADQVPERCWFSDGGISSNFPVHFFDAPLPSRPTFAINLRPFHRDYPYRPGDESRHVWMPERNSSGVLEWWNRFDQPEGGDRLFRFFGAIVDSMQNWMDNTQLAVPGYRDRVVHVSLRDSEGGLNLNMPEELIRELGERGRHAGLRLAARFGAGAAAEELSWDNHRWVRLRSTMAMLETMLTDICDIYDARCAGDRSYRELVARALGDPPPGYSWKNPLQRQFAVTAFHDIDQLVRAWQAERLTFVDGAPRPEPELRIRPRI